MVPSPRCPLQSTNIRAATQPFAIEKLFTMTATLERSLPSMTMWPGSNTPFSGKPILDLGECHSGYNICSRSFVLWGETEAGSECLRRHARGKKSSVTLVSYSRRSRQASSEQFDLFTTLLLRLLASSSDVTTCVPALIIHARWKRPRVFFDVMSTEIDVAPEPCPKTVI